MIEDGFEIRNTNRLKCKKNYDHEEEEEEIMPADLNSFDIISIDDDQEINGTLDCLFSQNADIQFSALNSLVKLSNFFPENVIQSLQPNHLNILYNFLENDKCKAFVIFIFSNLSRKDIFTPATHIFKTIFNILLNADSDDTEILYSLNLIKNLVQSKELYYSEALRYNIHQAIIENNKASSCIIKNKISALSAFLRYQNHDIDEIILSYLMQDVFIQSNKASIYREIINGFEFALGWSYKAIQIVNESNLIPISTNLLISDKTKNVVSALSFLQKCIITLEIVDIQFVKYFVLVLAKNDEDDDIFKDVILTFIVFVTQRASSRHFLFESICEIGIDALLSMKSFPVKKLFLSFLDESAKICPKEVMIIPPNVLSFFLQEIILTGETDLQILAIETICTVISSISNSGDASSNWAQEFAHSLDGFNILDNIYQSSVINYPDVTDEIDLLSSFLGDYAQQVN